ncbi:MAG: type II toxin-antitoxin system RelE/ParE family toxin [Candidatus Eremiobacteraeota bacterium]|nr:type II toxin-antitoxin system RelE/ParE family toxin [Candidatus Eremiobacteraeota bacterium]
MSDIDSSGRPWRVIIPPKIARQMRRLQPGEQGRIKGAIDSLRNFPHQGDLRDLKPNPEWRLKVGTRRILFKINKKEHIIGIIRIGSRGDVYK